MGLDEVIRVGCVGDDGGEAARARVGDVGVVGVADAYNEPEPDVEDESGEVGWSGDGRGRVDRDVAGDGGGDDDERRDGDEGEVSLLRSVVEFDDEDARGGGVGEGGVGGRAGRSRVRSRSRREPSGLGPDMLNFLSSLLLSFSLLRSRSPLTRFELPLSLSSSVSTFTDLCRAELA